MTHLPPAPLSPPLSRRAVLAGGALLVGFSLLPGTASAEDAAKPKLPGSLSDFPLLDAWLRIDATGITVFTGKAELGQGVRTALTQVAAEELGARFDAIHLVTADTARTPNEGFTSGSHSMQDSGTAIRNAAAQARGLLVAVAAERFGLPAEQLVAADGSVTAPDGRHASFGELVSDGMFHVDAQPVSPLRDPATYKLIGTSQKRVDIPAKMTGGVAYLQDMRLPGMLHARIVRPPNYGATLASVDESKAAAMPGVVKIVRDGSFLAVVAEREYQAVTALRALAASAIWQSGPALPAQAEIFQTLQALPSDNYTILDRHADVPADAKRFSARYLRPYHAHGSIGPSCAIGLSEGDKLTIWSHAQGMFPLRAAIAGLVKLRPDQVRCIHVEGSGCYGHNGADDAGGDAALLARAMPGRPIRVQWMREQEHAWEPYGPGMITQVAASLDDKGQIADWQYEVWSNTHSMRPGGAGALLASWSLAEPLAPPPPLPLPQPEGGGDRNAIPLYVFPNARVVHHFIPQMPIRVSAQRGLGAYMNIFTIESFMDELALAAGADPVEFRLRHLQDARGRDVVNLAAQKFGWSDATRLPEGHGRGFAFARYKNLGAYCAVAIEAAVARDTGRVRVVRANLAVDSGQSINPDGIRNQIEGGFLQSMSWSLFEQVTWDQSRITSRDWSTYPIMRFGSVPDNLTVDVINRPGMPYLGTGEAAQGPASAAIANAIAHATGTRMRDLPFTSGKVRAAVGV
jgi:nicotinate dehydrogenase subunit B